MRRRRIEDYALIGNGRTAALVGRNGSIDWLCWPRFDSRACFAALLGGPEHGRWLIAPKDPGVRITRHYVDGSLILVTTFTTATGVVDLTDFMPTGTDDASLVRLVRGVEGRVGMHAEFILRFDYGLREPWIERLDHHKLRVVAGADAATLHTSVPLQGRDSAIAADFEVSVGETLSFVLIYGSPDLPPHRHDDPERALLATQTYWAMWSNRCVPAGRWTKAVKRSLAVLKGLTFAPTGGMVAAPTTSLPLPTGGRRNRDDRDCWLRGSASKMVALGNAGHHDEAREWQSWLLRTVAGRPDQLQAKYGIEGERQVTEWEPPWLPGFDGMRPVRVGGTASAPIPFDVFGDIADTMFQARLYGLPAADRWSALNRSFLKHLETASHESIGIWETCVPRHCFTYAKVMVWVAFDRAVRSIEQLGMEGPLRAWQRTRDRIHADVCRNAFDSGLESFVCAYGSKALDATLLLLPIMGFLPPTDPRIVGTARAIENRLLVDGLVFRHGTQAADDGTPADEGALLACSFWFVDNLILQGRIREAVDMFERLLSLGNDVGLFAETYEPQTGCQMGNFPHAVSHVALINTAYRLASAESRTMKHTRHKKSNLTTSTDDVQIVFVDSNDHQFVR